MEINPIDALSNVVRNGVGRTGTQFRLLETPDYNTFVTILDTSSLQANLTFISPFGQPQCFDQMPPSITPSLFPL